MTSVDTLNPTSRLMYLLDAHEVEGDLMGLVPEHISVTIWKVTPGRVSAQYVAPATHGSQQIRADLGELASMFGLEYREERGVGGLFTTVSASGRRGRVQVEFWTNADRAGASA